MQEEHNFRLDVSVGYRYLVSIFVGFVLVFQSVVSLGPIFGIEINTRFWPIVNYAMYSRSFQEGDTVEVYRILEGVTEKGEIVDLSMDVVGMHLWQYRDLGRDIEKGNRDAIEFVVTFAPEGHRLEEVRIKSFPVAVTRDGPREQPSQTLAVIQLPEPGDPQ
jgi:hypothetical protein